RLSPDRFAVGADNVPRAADALPVHLTRRAVTAVGVQQVVVVRDLLGRVDAELRRSDSRSATRLALRLDRAPNRRAVALALAGVGAVDVERVDRLPLRADEDRAEVRLRGLHHRLLLLLRLFLLGERLDPVAGRPRRGRVRRLRDDTDTGNQG